MPQFRGLRNKKVLVTGGSSGIGQAIAVYFGRQGADVAINYLRVRDDAEETEDQIHAFHQCVGMVRDCGVETALVQADVSVEEDVTAMFATVIEELGGLDFVINNAGIQIPSPSHETTSDEFDKVLAVNLRGAFLCAGRPSVIFWRKKSVVRSSISPASIRKFQNRSTSPMRRAKAACEV